MPIKSEPYYWLECDECDARSPSKGDEYSAWVAPDQAYLYAEDSEWRIGERDLCRDCSLLFCENCDARIDAEFPGEQDYLCTPCWEKQDG